MTRKFSEIEPKHAGFTALVRAVQICGKRTELARRISVARGIEIDSSLIWNWLNRDSEIPLEYVPFIVAAADDVEVNPFTLRPDYLKGWLLLAKQLGAVTEDAPMPAVETA